MGSGINLGEFIKDNKDTLSEGWLDAVVGTYHDEAAGFIKGKDDRIANPMGYALSEMVHGVLECLEKGCDEQTLDSVMFPVIQMRAVQDFNPSDAVSFVVLLSDVAASLARKKGVDISDDLNAVIRGLLLRVFDMYSGCREKLGEIKVEELKRNLYMLLRDSDKVELKNSD